MINLILSATWDRFVHAKKEVQKCVDGAVIFMPHVIKNDTCNSTEDNIRLAHRNVWNLILEMNATVAVYEDDIVAFEISKCTVFISKIHERREDVIFLGDYRKFWALHAIIWTPHAARYMLERTNKCQPSRSKGVDQHLRNACLKKRLACVLANDQSHSGYVGRGFFVQDRLHIKSHLHDFENHNRVPPKHNIRPNGLWSWKS